MNLKMKSALAIATFAAMSFAQEPAAVAPAAEPAATEAKAEAAYTNLEKEVPETASAAPAAEAPAAEEAAAPVAVRGETEATPAPVAAAPVAEPAPAPVAAPAAEPAPQAVRTAQPAAQKPTYVERVYIGMDGTPVHTVYVAEQAGPDTVTMDQLRGRIPMEFKIGAQASVHSYYMSNGSYGDWDEVSFDGLAWRAGISATIPLNEYTMGVKLGLLYEQSNASENYYIGSGDDRVATHFKFEQKKLDIPVLFTFKSVGSRFFFDMGAQVSIPLQDELKVSFTDPDTKKKVKSSADMIDEDYRNSMDWSLVFGFSVLANKYISLDVRAELGLNDLYDGYLSASGQTDVMDLNLSTSSFGVGVTLYPF
ncbi:porin family protein [Fibrobacter sp. UWEL]|uniref:porin family protein n=1 Tax=Fibrobacter sp. UWEL TaxID=1896209 RepID=UPI00091A069E|nr:porin family protein [Fibrobacter sp. UWEL]SHK45670.1 Outer membrane protein beta-barrel domain-containing protein [Fibrobacter sp. UWEL]